LGVNFAKIFEINLIHSGVKAKLRAELAHLIPFLPKK
jgi:hypothetical protein